MGSGMEITFSCPECGAANTSEPEFCGMEICCLSCAADIVVPNEYTSVETHSDFATAQTDATTDPSPQYDEFDIVEAFERDLTCPSCWRKLEAGELMHIAVDAELVDDSVLGQDERQRFYATRFNELGHALDAMGMPCAELACPSCHRALPPGFVDQPQHVFSIVGQPSSGKSYFLPVATRSLSQALFNCFNLTFQDATPKGNTELTKLRTTLFSASTPEQAYLSKTQLTGAMYQRVPKNGREVLLPKPFVFSLASKSDQDKICNVVFYDNAGEHFRPDVDIVQSPAALHVGSASGIVFLLDPFHIPEWRRAMVGISDDPQNRKRDNLIDDQEVLLAELKRRIFETKGLNSSDRCDIPLAIVVPKLDAWMPLLPEPLISIYGDGRLDLKAIDHNSDLVRNLISRICPHVLASTEAFSSRVKYFAVSAFGHTPVEIVKSESTYIVPDPNLLKAFYTEHPFLWLLEAVASDLVSS